ncbi:MAG: hypothetical protein IAE77_00390 [Prosthecobacter sp.]|jgi:hypothetical protein|uniref:hypothetical protein n=1 Tax=Prosthecobacter sp. TaxID=1965333 RepID=UPI0019E90F17|nr:hypothetical protein [Prosthecobacter sp.]MBE2281897.1 hypothetical protein [Prosthecobacter sp.]
MPDEPNIDDLVAAIRPLAAEIVALQKQMKAMGMFANDRELLELPMRVRLSVAGRSWITCRCRRWRR